MSGQPRVIKLGGSLLDWPDLAASFHRWLARETPAANVIVAGGGPMVDALRQLDRVQPMPPETAHWLAIRAMSLTAALAAELLHDAVVVPALEQLRCNGAAGAQVLDVERLMREDAGRDDALPRGWEVTSDSIAARVAHRIDALELVLLKSGLPDGPATRDALSCRGYVDAYFPVAAKSLTVRCVNLRDGEFPQLKL